jgi:hypothetical protein
MIGRARLAIAGTAWATAALLGLAPLSAGSAIAAAGSTDDSSVTVSGAGAFASLKVTVSQTTGLIDQVVRVSWTGGTPTPIGFKSDYLQIMQCWGDDPTGPTRDHCEFGNSGDTRGGAQVTTRQLDAGASFADPNETQVATPDNPYNYVPFVSHTLVDDPANPGHEIHPTVLGDHADLGQFFDAQSTNEEPLNATGADGTGEAYFETQTGEEAPGLGCGSVDTDASGATTTPYCWMVIVPRGETEVNGAPSSSNGAGLVSTPLSASNWANRIVIPLTFTPIGLSCPIGSPEQRTSGQEIAAEAVFRWQAQLCKQSGTVYSYAETSDDSARRQLFTSNPGLSFISQPVAPTTAGSANVVYAPVAVSGAVIAFNIDYSAYGNPALQPLAGQRVPQINLTPRLVAKLITQSYQQGAPQGDPALSASHAVSGLTYDPDFAAVNPGLAGLNSGTSGGGDVLMPFAPSDVTQELWTWINSDADARAFLEGAPDPWGMTVNPNYLKITDGSIPSSFPKQDPYCAPQQANDGTQPPDLCTLDDRPYANDMHDGARSASRGDTLSRAAWDPTAMPPHYGKVPLQLSGVQSVLAFTDAATAARYSLPVARLENAAGQFVAPTSASLLAGVASMTASGVPGVLQANPSATDPAAYPLTSISYAATVPAKLSPTARSNYADFLQYAVTGGQTPGLDLGNLPFGYAPLTQPLVTQALVASVAIRTYVAPPATSTPAATPTVTHTAKPTVKPKPKPTVKPKPTKTSVSPTPSATPDPAPTTTTYVPPPVLTVPTSSAPQSLTTTPPSPAPTTILAPTTTTTPAPATSAAPAPSEAPSLGPVAEIRPTPPVKAGGSRYAFIVILAIGGLCALSGPTLLRFGGRGRP